ncbi:MAG: hypothetical protein EA401_01655, partial [Planctomycetota bacterium]
MPRASAWVWLLTVVAFCVSGPLWSVELRLLEPAHSVRPGEVLEWEVRDIPSEWLQHEVTETPYLIITEADGRSYRRNSFLIRPFRIDRQQRQGEFMATGDATLHLRHSPRVSGAMRWTLHPPHADAADEPLAQGRLHVHAGPSVAAITAWEENHRFLQSPTGQPMSLIGVNIAWAIDHDQDRLATMVGYLDRFAQRGGNHIRLWAASWFGNISSQQGKHWRLDHAWLLDEVLKAAAIREIAVTLVLDNHTDFLHNSHMPYPQDLQQRQEIFFGNGLTANYQAR